MFKHSESPSVPVYRSAHIIAYSMKRCAETLCAKMLERYFHKKRALLFWFSWYSHTVDCPPLTCCQALQCRTRGGPKGVAGHERRRVDFPDVILEGQHPWKIHTNCELNYQSPAIELVKLVVCTYLIIMHLYGAEILWMIPVQQLWLGTPIDGHRTLLNCCYVWLLAFDCTSTHDWN